MKLAIDARPLIDNKPSGIGKLQIGLVNELLKDSRFEITLVSSGKRVSHLQKHIPEVHKYKHAHVATSNRLLNVCWATDIPPQFDKFLSQFDLFLMPYINFFPLRSHVPLAVITHDLSFMHDPKYNSLKRRIWHRAIRPHQLLKRASKIIAVSESTRSQIFNFFPDINPAFVKTIYPGITLPKYPDDDSEILQRLAIPEKYIFFVGTIEPRKNLLAASQAFTMIANMFPDTHFLIAGNLGWINKKEYASIFSHPRIRNCGYISDEEKHVLLRHAQLLVWPSFYEGFGFPPLEALAHGTPVVVSHKTSLSEVLGQSALYVNPYNTYELATVMRSTLTKAPLITPQDVGLAETFSWERSARQMADFLLA